MSASTITITGWVANDPVINKIDSTTRFVSFRMGSTPRYYDRNKSEWVDGKTEWFTVKAWRDTADNIAESIRKSQPVLVYGRFATNEWESDTGPRKDLVIDAISVGHDLTRGRTNFTKIVSHTQEDSGTEQAEDQAPDTPKSFADLGIGEESSDLVGAA